MNDELKGTELIEEELEEKAEILKEEAEEAGQEVAEEEAEEAEQEIAEEEAQEAEQEIAEEEAQEAGREIAEEEAQEAEQEIAEGEAQEAGQETAGEKALPEAEEPRELSVQESTADLAGTDESSEEERTKALASWAQSAANKMTGGNVSKANQIKAHKNSLYQVDCSVQLEEKKFLEVSIWNMFGRKKIYGILMAIIYGLSLTTIGGSIPRIKSGDTNGFIMSGGMGLIMLAVVSYMVYSNINRFRRASKNEEYLKRTAKHFRFTREQITNYRVEAQEERKYEWNQVAAAYDRPEEIILAMKTDGQLLVVEKKRLNDRETEFLKDIITEKKLWKKDSGITWIYFLFGAVTLLGLLYIIWMIIG